MKSEIKSFAHDINNQLQIVSLLMESLVREVKTQTVSKRTLLEIIQKIDLGLSGITSLSKEALVGENLQVSRISNNIEKVLKLCEKYPMEIEFSKYKDPLISFYSSGFERSFLNILKNAKESGSTKIIIELRDKILSIRDNGGGLTNEQISDFKMGKFISTKITGHGIGIASLYDYCDRLGWELELKTVDIQGELNQKGLKISINFSLKSSLKAQ
jgi:nitrogen fixation/metabolism regulation signal transduction histidine kinase